MYIFMNGLPINECYKKGNSRAGCLMCPMTSGRSVFFRRDSYPDEVNRFTNYIADNVNDENIDSYITNGGRVNRKSGRDLKSPVTNYGEEIIDGRLHIIVIVQRRSAHR